MSFERQIIIVGHIAFWCIYVFSLVFFVLPTWEWTSESFKSHGQEISTASLASLLTPLWMLIVFGWCTLCQVSRRPISIRSVWAATAAIGASGLAAAIYLSIHQTAFAMIPVLVCSLVAITVGYWKHRYSQANRA